MLTATGGNVMSRLYVLHILIYAFHFVLINLCDYAYDLSWNIIMMLLMSRGGGVITRER